ncbi:MAG: PaaI family thioesterase [Raoultibacter sp.]|jgi:acyl-CoA thioesterase
MSDTNNLVLPKTASFAEIVDYFQGDRFATEAAGCKIVEASYGRAVCEMEITPKHFNANGQVMGGALFTLADYALAIVCNVGEAPTVGISNTIEFYNTAKGKKLIAECVTDKSGRTIGFYTVMITDELGTQVAKLISSCFRRS